MIFSEGSERFGCGIIFYITTIISLAKGKKPHRNTSEMVGLMISLVTIRCAWWHPLQPGPAGLVPVKNHRSNGPVLGICRKPKKEAKDIVFFPRDLIVGHELSTIK